MYINHGPVGAGDSSKRQAEPLPELLEGIRPGDFHGTTSHAPRIEEHKREGSDVGNRSQASDRPPSPKKLREDDLLAPSANDIPSLPATGAPQSDEEGYTPDVHVDPPVAAAIVDDGSRVLWVRHGKHAFVYREDTKDCLLLKWKTLKKGQRKGRELDAKWFNEQERQMFDVADEKEWQSFIDTGAAVIISPQAAKQIPHDRIFSRPFRWVRTNKDKTGEDINLEAKSRLVTPGDVDPDGEVPVEAGGFRTDAPSAPQLGFHMLCSLAARRRW
jgi:hypothetical protein